MGDLPRAARFFASLYADRAARQYAARVRGDLPARLAMREGRLDPYPVYERVRERGTFVPNRFGGLATADHAVCDEILRSRRFGVQPAAWTYDPTDPELAGPSMLGANPPDHGRLRRVAAPAFGPRAIDSYRPLITKRIHELVDAAEREGEFDFVARVASPLPIAVITSLLGIPGEHETEFVRYGMAIGGALTGVRGIRHARELQRADAALDAIFTELVALRRHEPGDDVISTIVAADELHPAELKPLCTLLLIAGFETTVNALGNAVLAFAAHPGEWERLVAEPSLATEATEEVLRYDSSVQRTDRFSFDDTEIAGQPISAGQNVQILIGGANRDPAVFEDPAHFDLTRPNASSHLSFSSGIHYCLGQPLARLELAIALEALATRLPRLRVSGRPRYRPSTLLRGPLRLPVAVG
ncbi:cytochrome P450 [Nocardioides sp. KR10-350]|uniref:cytochrome P450 n=1 Tax=Nocardioides cheoyonin TaxID=3156615 RepID=UPI0032B602F3